MQITVVPPEQLFLDLEDRLEERFGLQEALVIEAQPGESQEVVSRRSEPPPPGTWCARSVPTARSNTLRAAPCITWLRRCLRNGSPRPRWCRSSAGWARPTRKYPCHRALPAPVSLAGCPPDAAARPGVIAPNKRTRGALLSDIHVQRAAQTFDHLDIAFVGVGAPTPNSVTMRDGSIITQAELDELLRDGAVGDIALRFFDAHGRGIASESTTGSSASRSSSCSARPRSLVSPAAQRSWPPCAER